MYDWEKFNKTTLRKKEQLCSNFKVEEITDAYYMHGKRICKCSEIKNIISRFVS